MTRQIVPGSDPTRVPNADEIAYWNSESGSRWVSFQEHIDRAFEPLGAAGIASAKIERNADVLDIGCGCGATLLGLANAVGADGRVVGVDVSQPMLLIAEKRAERLGHTHVRCLLADAATHAFDEAGFDLVFSRFGVMFFDDPAGAFGNLRRSLRPTGSLVFVCWRDLAANPWFSVPADAVRPYAAPQPQLDPDAPGPLAFADSARVRRILELAGFADVEFEAFDTQLRLGDRTSATELLSQVGPTSRLLAGVDGSTLVDAKRALNDALQAHETEGDVMLGAGVWIVRARPASLLR